MAQKPINIVLDLGAATSFGTAVWFALSSALQLPPSSAIGGGVLAFALAASGLAWLSDQLPRTDRFAIIPLHFVREEEEALLLDRPIETTSDSPVVRLLKPIPTPGELHQTIERHLQRQEPPERDDVEKLSHALAELRRAIR